jgi:predicted Rossmann fold flavoprotein
MLYAKVDAMIYDFIVIGGGAAGVFAAIQAKEANPKAKVLLLEKSAVLLAKVRVSGGGRCNVTHSCFDPRLLVQNYPRGNQQLLGPFHRFQPRDTIAWFEERGVPLKTEADGRIFPCSDQSESIISCLLGQARLLGVEVRFRQRVQGIIKDNHTFMITMKDDEQLMAYKLLLATGSSAEGCSWAESLGHTLQPPVPSLFTFNVPTSSLKELSGIALPDVGLHLKGTFLRQRGPFLITHFGFSGPAVLKLSAWGARYLHGLNYRAELVINWLPGMNQEELRVKLNSLKATAPSKTLLALNPFGLPRNFWKSLLDRYGDVFKKALQHIPGSVLYQLSECLSSDTYSIDGKTTHKEEFVTCGGVTLNEVCFKTMESRRCPGLFFAGEILDIDGITGGFNFQNAWTTAWIVGRSTAL